MIYIRTSLPRPPSHWRKLGQEIKLDNPTPEADRAMRLLGFVPKVELQRELVLSFSDAYCK